MNIIVRKMVEEDIKAVAEIHKKAFQRQQESKKWIKCNFQAYPRMQYYIASKGDSIIGYILWIQKSGFRSKVVLELEQIAVLPSEQGKGIGSKLIEETLPMVRRQLSERTASIKHIIVTTRADNTAQRLYRKTLGVEVECIIKDLYSQDEVIMIARNLDTKWN
jgi:ribosomal protein S18 acetylase RimI-like enzyme